MTDMTDEMLVHLHINGEDRAVAVRPNTTLLEVVRHQLGLTGTKRGCGTGDCGACTVLADGKPVNACLMLAVAAEGLKITTIEGMADGGQLHPLQQSFVKHAALQCGYCTSGALMSAKALVDANAAPTEDEINTALSGNLCRCGTYPRMRQAIAGWKEFVDHPYDLEPHDHGECDQQRDHEVVGRGVPRTDAVAKVTGRAKYTADHQLPARFSAARLPTVASPGSTSTRRAPCPVSWLSSPAPTYPTAGTVSARHVRTSRSWHATGSATSVTRSPLWPPLTRRPPSRRSS